MTGTERLQWQTHIIIIGGLQPKTLNGVCVCVCIIYNWVFGHMKKSVMIINKLHFFFCTGWHKNVKSSKHHNSHKICTFLPTLNALNIPLHAVWSIMQHNPKTAPPSFHIYQHALDSYTAKRTCRACTVQICRRVTVSSSHLSTPVASEWTAMCQWTGKNSTRWMCPLLAYGPKWDLTKLLAMDRKSSTGKKEMHDSTLYD